MTMPNDSSMVCPNCFAAPDALSIAKCDRSVEASDGVAVPYSDELTVCASCGERFYTHEQALAASRARAGALRTRDGLLAPDDIRALRKKYGLTQDQLERMLRVGPKTVVRWERGTVCQSPGIDTLMTLIRDDPSAAQRLAARAGIELELDMPVVSSTNLIEEGVGFRSLFTYDSTYDASVVCGSVFTYHEHGPAMSWVPFTRIQASRQALEAMGICGGEDDPTCTGLRLVA